jgi:hypothetical protein
LHAGWPDRVEEGGDTASAFGVEEPNAVAAESVELARADQHDRAEEMQFSRRLLRECVLGS